MIRAGLFACLVVSPALAEVCVNPVENGQPAAGIETEQPSRMAPTGISVPGYPNLIIAPINRNGLYTIKDGRFEPLVADFPRMGLWMYRRIATLADGRVIGAGQRPNILFQLDPDAGVFKPIRGTEDYWRAGYDAETQTYRFATPDGALFDLAADGPQISALPTAPHLTDLNGTLPRYVPDMAAYLSAGDDALWALPDGADQWHRIRMPRRLHNQLYQLDGAPIAVDTEQRIAQIKLGNHFVVLDIARQVPKRHYTVSDVGTAAIAHGRFIFEQRRYSRRFFSPKSSRWPDLQILTRDGPDAVPGVPEITPTNSNIAPFGLKPIGIEDRVLVWLNESWWVYDGQSIAPAPDHLDLPRSIWPVTHGDDGLWENGKSVWRLDDALRSAPVALPSRGDGMRIERSDAFGGHFLVSNGNAWFSADLETFEPIRGADVAALEHIIADLPDTKATLAVGKGGLYLFEECD